MTIGFCRIDLYLPECASLKQKRGVLKGVIARTRNKFNVAVAELDDHDRWQRARLGVVTITNESRYANRVLSQVVNAIEREDREDRLILMDYSLELL